MSLTARLSEKFPSIMAWVVMAGAWAQCSLRAKSKNPWYRTAFSMALLALAMEAAAQALRSFGGRDLSAPADVVIPAIVASALVYFLVNSVLMATAIGLSEGRSPLRIWDGDLLWSSPNYFIGALAAVVAVQGWRRFGIGSIALFTMTLVITYRLYAAFVRRVDDVQRESQTDPLTRLPNRRFLAEHAAAEIARADRAGEPLALLMIDLNQFKQINDTYGHQKGDEALELVADRLRRGLRPYDVCCRYAGDEFVMVLNGCDAELARRRAEELIESIRAARLTVNDYEACSVSASIGVASYPADGHTYPELLAVADARMYSQKHEQPVAAGSRD